MSPIVIALFIWFIVLALLIGLVAGAGESRIHEHDPVRLTERAWRVRTALLGILFAGMLAIPFIGHGRALRHFIGG
jgi:hypothetical protein